MRAIFFVALIFLEALCFIVGCARITAQSTSALYDPKTELKFDPRLLGVWLPDSVCVHLRRGEANSYLVGPGGLSWLVVFGDAANKTRQPDSVHLVKIGNYDYFFAAPKADETGTTFTGCCKVEFQDDRVTLRGLNLQTVTDDLITHPESLRHEWVEQPAKIAATARPTSQAATMPASQPAAQNELHNGNLKITDDAPAIRKYLIDHQDDAAFFSDPIVMYRIAK